MRVWERVVGHRVGGDEAGEGEEKEVTGVVGCRMLAAGGQVGCVLGKGGKTVERMPTVQRLRTAGRKKRRKL